MMTLHTDLKQMDRTVLENLAVEDYVHTLRPQLRTGDLLFASGNYQFSRTIQKVTQSLWSHVGMIVLMHGRVLLLESNELVGVRLIPLSRYGCVVLARRNDMDEQTAMQAVRAGVDELTRPYNHTEIMNIVYRVATDQIREHTEHPHTYICSELVHYCLAQANLPVQVDVRGFISPHNLWNQPEVALLGRVL
jgi:Permuted papain-like amidase enzyme, YaeF/YiiX, C92 family